MADKPGQYPQELEIEIDGLVHLRRPDEPHSDERITGLVRSFPNEGEYRVSLDTESGRVFQELSGWIIVVIILIVVLDWPRPADSNPPPPPEGPPSEGPPPEGPPPEGPPSEGPPSEGPPSEGPPSEGPPSEGPPSEGPPSEGPPSEGPPSEGPPSEGPPSEGPPSEGPPSEGPPSEGPPSGIWTIIGELVAIEEILSALIDAIAQEYGTSAATAASLQVVEAASEMMTFAVLAEGVDEGALESAAAQQGYQARYVAELSQYVLEPAAYGTEGAGIWNSGQWAENFLDLTGGEYSGVSRLSLPEGWGMKRFLMRRLSETRFRAEVETTHAYPRSHASHLARLLPNDIVLVDDGPGRAYGRSTIRWLRDDGKILTGDMQIHFDFKNKEARLPFPQIFSYEYGTADVTRRPFELVVRGLARPVLAPKRAQETGPPQLDRPD